MNYKNLSLYLFIAIVFISSSASVEEFNSDALATSPAFIRRIPRILFFDESKLGITCNSHKECDLPFIVCTGTDHFNVLGICEHKNLFPMTGTEIQGIIVIILSGMLAISAGLGGGSLFVPLMMIFFGMNAHMAIPLSNALTFANSVVSYVQSFNTKHPDIPHKPIVDFNVAILFNPMMMIGSFAGVIIQVLLPGIFSQTILFATLVLATIKGIRGTIKAYKQENEMLSENKDKKIPLMKKDDCNEHEMRILQGPDEDDDRHEHYVETLDEKTNRLRIDAIEKISQTEADTFPWDKMKLVITSFVVTILAPFVQGGKGNASFFGIEKCTWSYYIGSAGYVAIVLFLWYKAFKIILEEERLKSNVVGGWPFREALQWEQGTMIILSIKMFIVGVFSSIIGVGGGIYIVPILSDLGYPAQVVSATSLFLVFWAKFASTLLFAFNGTLIFDYTVILCLLAAIGSYISLKAIKKIMDKFDRQSFIKMFFAGFVFLAGVITFIKIYGLLLGDNKGFDIWAFQSYCT